MKKLDSAELVGTYFALSIPATIGTVFFWFLIFGWLHNWACIAQMPQPMDLGFSMYLGFFMLTTAIALGMVCSFGIAIGRCLDSRFISYVVPFALGAVLIGVMSWALPHLPTRLSSVSVIFRPWWSRILWSVAMSVPASALVVFYGIIFSPEERQKMPDYYG